MCLAFAIVDTSRCRVSFAERPFFGDIGSCHVFLHIFLSKQPPLCRLLVPAPFRKIFSLA